MQCWQAASQSFESQQEKGGGFVFVAKVETHMGVKWRGSAEWQSEVEGEDEMIQE